MAAENVGQNDLTTILIWRENTPVLESLCINGFQLCKFARAIVYITLSLCLYTKISPVWHKQKESQHFCPLSILKVQLGQKFFLNIIFV